MPYPIFGEPGLSYSFIRTNLPNEPITTLYEVSAFMETCNNIFTLSHNSLMPHHSFLSWYWLKPDFQVIQRNFKMKLHLFKSIHPSTYISQQLERTNLLLPKTSPYRSVF